MKGGLEVMALDTSNLSDNELRQIAGVETDMWACCIGEYVKCECCGKIHSKNDIYGHLEWEIKKESVIRLEEILAFDSIRCKDCDSTNTNFIYDVDKNIVSILDRYKNSVASYLSVLHDEKGDRVWFCDWYVDNFRNIYDREFIHHYWEMTDEEYIKFMNKMWYETEKLFLTISSLGTQEKYKSLNLLKSLVKNFTSKINFSFLNLDWIIEIDKNSILYEIYLNIWFKNLFFPNQKYNLNYISEILETKIFVEICKRFWDLNKKNII
mgnify:CR=1 FL=1